MFVGAVLFQALGGRVVREPLVGVGIQGFGYGFPFPAIGVLQLTRLLFSFRWFWFLLRHPLDFYNSYSKA